MSLIQCENCGCVDNTALCSQGMAWTDCFDWTGKEDLKGKKLCSACGPSRLSDGKPSKHGVWHGRFPRLYLPKGQFKTNRVGNLEHIETGSEDYPKFALSFEDPTP